MGSARLAGWRMRDQAGDAPIVHAWSQRALLAGRELALATGRAMVYSVPAAPAEPADMEDLRKAVGPGLLNVVAPTRFAVGRLVAAGLPERFCHTVAPAARPLSAADAADARGRVREALGIGGGVKLLVSPDPFVRGAGHEYASWSHAILRHIPLELRLAFPSAGPMEEHFRFFAATTGFDEEVHFTQGRLAAAEVIAAADFAVFAQERDCGPMTMASAMAAGVPVAASGAGSLVELADGGRCGLLMGTGPRQTSAGLLKLVSDDSLAADLARSAAQAAQILFTPATVAAKLQEVYAKAMETKAI